MSKILWIKQFIFINIFLSINIFICNIYLFMYVMKINEICYEFEVEWGRVYIEVGKKGRYVMI